MELSPHHTRQRPYSNTSRWSQKWIAAVDYQLNTVSRMDVFEYLMRHICNMSKVGKVTRCSMNCAHAGYSGSVGISRKMSRMWRHKPLAYRVWEEVSAPPQNITPSHWTCPYLALRYNKTSELSGYYKTASQNREWRTEFTVFVNWFSWWKQYTGDVFTFPLTCIADSFINHLIVNTKFPSIKFFELVLKVLIFL